MEACCQKKKINNRSCASYLELASRKLDGTGRTTGGGAGAHRACSLTWRARICYLQLQAALLVAGKFRLICRWILFFFFWQISMDFIRSQLCHPRRRAIYSTVHRSDHHWGKKLFYRRVVTSSLFNHACMLSGLCTWSLYTHCTDLFHGHGHMEFRLPSAALLI